MHEIKGQKPRTMTETRPIPLSELSVIVDTIRRPYCFRQLGRDSVRVGSAETTLDYLLATAIGRGANVFAAGGAGSIQRAGARLGFELNTTNLHDVRPGARSQLVDLAHAECVMLHRPDLTRSKRTIAAHLTGQPLLIITRRRSDSWNWATNLASHARIIRSIADVGA